MPVQRLEPRRVDETDAQWQARADAYRQAVDRDRKVLGAVQRALDAMGGRQ